MGKGRIDIPGSGALRAPAGSARLRLAAGSGDWAWRLSACGKRRRAHRPDGCGRAPTPPPSVLREGAFPQGPLAPLPPAPRPQAAGALPAGARSAPLPV